MSGTSTVGGLLAIVGGLFILVQMFISWSVIWGVWSVVLIINLAIGGCGLIGGVFGMKAQKGAGVLALIVGVLSIILGIISVQPPSGNYIFLQLSLFSQTMGIGNILTNLTIGISLEAILIIVGGILIIVGSKKE